MWEKILGWLGKIATGEKRRWFFATLIIIAILVVIAISYIDANLLYYNRIEKRIENLSNLVNLTQTPLEENAVLYEEYLSILDEMKIARVNTLFGSGKIEDSKNNRIWKFAGGALLWVVLAVVLLFPKRKGASRTSKQHSSNLASAIFCLLIGGVLGCVFVYIPTMGNAIINFVFGFIAQIIVMWLIIESPKSKTPVKEKKE